MLASLLVILIALPVGADAPTSRHSELLADDTLILAGLEKRFEAVANRIAPSVVAISGALEPIASEDAGDRAQLSAARVDELLQDARRTIGSGFVLSEDGYILTNEHVISGARQLWITTEAGRAIPAIVVGSDPRSDLAVIKVPVVGLAPVRFAEPETLQRGHWVIAAGNPLGISTLGKTTISVGVVSAIDRELPKLASRVDRRYHRLIQTTAAVNPGSSGGPLFNLNGEVVGMTTAVVLPQRQVNGIGFAIPLGAEAQQLIARLRIGDEIKYGFLGVNVSDPPAGSGVVVGEISQDSPAAGTLKSGDRLIDVNGNRVVGSEEFVDLVGALAPNHPAEVRLVRDERILIVTLTPTMRQLPSIAVHKDTQVLRVHGATFAQRAGAGDHAARVVVLEISEDSPLKKLGIAKNCVIASIGNDPVRDLLDFHKKVFDLPLDRWNPRVEAGR